MILRWQQAGNLAVQKITTCLPDIIDFVHLVDKSDCKKGQKTMKKLILAILLLALLCSIGAVSYADNSYFDMMLDGMNNEELNALKEAIDQKLAAPVDAGTGSTQVTGETKASDFLYASDGETVVIRAYKGTSPIVIIPEEIEGAKVTTIAEKAFETNESVTSVVFPRTIEKIGEHAFYNCKNLQNIRFPKERMTSLYIESSAFGLCEIKNPLILQADSLKIGVYAFGYNTDLPSVILLGDEIIFRDYPFSGCKSLKQVYVDPSATVSYDGYYLNSKNGDVFKEMDSLEEVFLPADCAFLTENTFKNSPNAVVYAEEGSPVLDLAKSLWIPTNSQEYEAKCSVINKYLENNGYIESTAQTDVADPETLTQEKTGVAEEAETQSTSKSDDGALERALATANSFETMTQDAFDYIDKWGH